jgi:cytochrome c-type biogenesis protein CcmH/NrfG
MFVTYVTILLTLVLLWIAFPLWRKTPKPLPVGVEAARGEERLDLLLEKQNVVASLRELEEDLSSGKLSQGDYQRLRSVDEHRLAAILDRLDAIAATGPIPPKSDQQAASAAPAPTFRIMNLSGSMILILLVAGGASGIYSYLNAKALKQQEAQQGGGGAPPAMGGAPNPLEMVARLERRLRENPNDLQGQMMAGRSYMSLQRYGDAAKAWAKVVEMDPANAEGHYNAGLLIVQASRPHPDNPAPFQQAIAHFDSTLQMVPNEPAALYYKGVALFYLKRYDEAEKAWSVSLKGLPPDSEDGQFIREEIRQLRATKPVS